MVFAAQLPLHRAVLVGCLHAGAPVQALRCDEAHSSLGTSAEFPHDPEKSENFRHRRNEKTATPYVPTSGSRYRNQGHPHARQSKRECRHGGSTSADAGSETRPRVVTTFAASRSKVRHQKVPTVRNPGNQPVLPLKKALRLVRGPELVGWPLPRCQCLPPHISELPRGRHFVPVRSPRPTPETRG